MSVGVNLVDGIVLVALAVVALRGWLRGLFREAFAVVGIVAGVFLAIAHGEQLGALLTARRLVWPVVAVHVASVLLFFAAYVVAAIAGIVVRRLARALFLGGVDRAGGVVLGLVRGAALAGVALALVPKILPPDAGLVRALDRSVLGRPLAELGRKLLDAGRRFAPRPAGQSV